MTQSFDPLFQPLALPAGPVIKNRFLKAAMSETLADRHNNATAAHAALYARWASGGTGLVITGNVMVDRRALGEPGNVVLDARSDRAALRAWTQAGTTNDTQLWVQLNHPGRQSPLSMTREPVAPSAIPLGGSVGFAFAKPRALTVAEIHAIVARFAQAALIAKETGFSGVEIHGAHGYLIDQFLSPAVNERTDEYGGSLTNRMRFLVEVYNAIRAAVGPAFPVGLKINSSDLTPNGFSQADSLAVIQVMARLGLDLIEISGGGYENQRTNSTATGAFFVDYAAQVKATVTIPVAVTGGFRTERGMRQAVANHETDLVGLARGLVVDPALPAHIQANSAQPVTLRHLSTGITALDQRVGGLVGLAYYQQQLKRLAQGLNFHRTTNAWGPLWAAVRAHGLKALLPQRGK